jgi:tetratricopeptide (TPR) repeat protein
MIPRLGALAVALALAAGPARADLVSNGDRALAAGRLDEAMRIYEGAARDGNAMGEAGVGRVWLRRARYDKALEAFQRASQMDAALAYAYYGQGEALRRLGRCEEGLPLMRKATQLDRKFPEAQLGIGNCLVATGHVDEAITELNRGLNWKREWTPRFLVARGTAHLARDSLRPAGIDFTRARELAPRDPEVRRAGGDFYVARGTWALAIPEYQAAVAVDSNDVETWTSLARALDFGERYDESLQAYRHATSLDSSYPPALLGLANLLYRAGTGDPRRYAEARAPLERYLELTPADPKGLSLLGRLYAHLGVRDSALTIMLKAEQLGDRSKELYTELGRAHAERKDWQKALDAFSKGQPGPEDEPLIAQIFDVTGRADAADSLYSAILARDSTGSRAAFVFTQRAKLRFRAKDYARADSLFGKAIALDPRIGEAHFYRGLSLKELGRAPEALTELQKAAEIDTSKADRFFWLGAIYDAQKATDDAEQAFRRSVSVDSVGPMASKAYRQLGFYRLLKKQWPAAIALLQRAVTLDAQDSQAWLWLAQGYQNSGSRERASEAYRRVLALDPGNANAKNGLKSLASRGNGRPAPGS